MDAVLSRYRQAKAVQSKVKKIVVQELVGSSSESKGNFYFSKGKLRLDFTEPEKTLLVYDGKYVWLESRMEEMVSVTKIATGELKKSDSLLAALFEKQNALKGFRLIESKSSDQGKVYSFEPKDKTKTEIQYLELGLKKDSLKYLVYRDQVENKVSFEFEKIYVTTVPASKFKYKPPRGANVTEIQ